MRRLCVLKSSYGVRGGASVYSYNPDELKEDGDNIVVTLYSNESSLEVNRRVDITQIETVPSHMVDWSFGRLRLITTGEVHGQYTG